MQAENSLSGAVYELRMRIPVELYLDVQKMLREMYEPTGTEPPSLEAVLAAFLQKQVNEWKFGGT